VLTQNAPIPSDGNNTPTIYGPTFGDFGSLARVDALADGQVGELQQIVDYLLQIIGLSTQGNKGTDLSM